MEMKSAGCLFCLNIKERVTAEEGIYLKRGYRLVSYEKIETENGGFLCYHIMEKKLENLFDSRKPYACI